MEDNNHELDGLRHKIDALDEELLSVIAQRMDIVRVVGEYKKAHGLPALDQARWQAVLDARIARAHVLNQPADFITRVYTPIHEQALKIEDDIINGPS
ncbi:MAG TPA: chorismate mutase [Candidatus Dormibacteraeota bacterium]|nr:chorismate mutase [Candidatus Dormibacteraeota bacterium]